MSKDFKNILYLVLISALCIVLPLFIPPVSALFSLIPLAQIILVFFATQFAGASRLASLLSAIGILLYVLFAEKIWIGMIHLGLLNFLIPILVVLIIIFIVEYIILHNKNNAVKIASKSFVWILLAFVINIVLSIFLAPALMMLHSN